MTRWLLVCFCVPYFALMGQHTLEWRFRHPLSKQWIALGTKGSVQEALIATGELPDPFVGTNEDKFYWIEDHDWEFQSEFTLTAAELQHDHIDIELPNVDTYATVLLNGKEIGRTENAFVTYRFSIKGIAIAGANQLKLVFRSPVNYQRDHMAEVGVKLPAPNDLGKIAVAPYCRKPQYQFGWDWSIRMQTIGFWKPATIVAYDDNRVIGNNYYTSLLTDDYAIVALELLLRDQVADTLTWNSSLFGSVKLSPENGVLKRIERIDNPELWWPRGHGAQHLYEDECTLTTASGKVLYSGKLRFGVRKSELITEADQWGTSYVIRINNRDIFCKGANYIPQDVFPAKVDDASVRKMVELMHASNFNMVRVWGGGYYPSEAFYAACDELGIMVWQDFMFACAMYPGNDPFLQNVELEFSQQVPRIASHPAVVLFNGNNEVEVAWKNWGFMSTFKLTTKDADIIQAYYDRLFKGTLPNAVKRWTTTPYIHTSPLSNWGKDEYFAHGTMHYWGVWHGKDPIEDFGRKTGRFNAEYGFQSFPEFSTLATFSEKKDWDLESLVMKHHQKSYVGNGMIARHANILYGKTPDFERFVYYSQLTQAVAVSMAISGHRSLMPRCSGTIFWQLNDCWPAPTWSSVDYLGNWKALHYAVRDDYRDVAVVAKIDTLGKEKFMLISDLYKGFACDIRCELFDLEGRPLETFQCNLAIMAPEVQQLFQHELAKYANTNYYATFHWNDADGQQYDRSFTHLPKLVPDAAVSDVQLSLENVDEQAKTATIVIANTKFVRKLWISSPKPGMHFDRNFLDLLPGTHEIHITFDTVPVAESLKLMWL